MYYITTKTHDHTDGSPFRVLAAVETRTLARALAATKHPGTVRTQAEVDELLAKGRLDPTTMPGYQPPPPPAPKTFVELAKAIADAPKARRTIGKAEKVLKRYDTDAAVLATAGVFLINYIATEKDWGKVDIVRALTAWVHTDGTTRLQRKDVFALLKERGVDIAGATISTQFQLVRSGKWPSKKKA